MGTLTGYRLAPIITISDIFTVNILFCKSWKGVKQNVERDPEALLPLTPAAYHILLALVGCERHGYGIMREIHAYTEGKLRIGAGTLYRSIKHMLADGLIAESDERPDPELDDERRHYYRLTNFGERVVQAETERLLHLVSIAQAKQLRPDTELTTSAGRA